MLMADRSRLRLVLLVAVLLVVAGHFGLAEPVPSDESIAEAQMEPVIYLSDLPWESATTGWVALADDNLPRRDSSFSNGAITLGGESYQKGIGTFPLSEIVYALQGQYALFQAEVGVDGAVPSQKGSVVFKLFLDDVLAYDSGVLHAGEAPRHVELPVSGVERIKLMVEDAGDGSTLDYADWADARLTRAGEGWAPSAETLRRTLDSARADRQMARDRDRAALQQRSARELADFAEIFPQGQTSEASAAFDPQRQALVLANDRIELVLGYGGERHGLLDVVDLAAGRMVASGTSASLTTAKLSTLVLSRDTTTKDSDGYYFRRVDVPALGMGVELTADFPISGSDATISSRLTLFDDSSYFTYQLELRDTDPAEAVRSFSYFDRQQGGYLVVGEGAEYLADYSLTRRAELRDDSVVRQELVGLGKPLLLYNKSGDPGVLMAVIDEVEDPAHFSIRLETGHVAAQMGFEHRVPDDVRARRIQDSPRLFFQVTPSGSAVQATVQYRQVMASLYPQPQLPSWAKYQWGSWYAFYMNYDEDTIRGQVDYIAKNLADLGPWSILLDAGWYVAEGRPESTWDSEDPAKFPNGLRALVDYAHSKGIKVVLYFSAPYLDDREREGNWLGLRGFVEQHPDWVIRLQSDGTGASYVYDFTNPELVEYMRTLIGDFFRVYDVDGIKIDGLGQAEGEQLAAEERDTFGDVNKIRMFTMDIYRLIYEEAVKAKKDAYIESGWAIPNLATQFAHTFRYGDEFPEFENHYPAGGLVEHIDYATIQKTVLGQRPNMGMVWGGPESEGMIRLWFQSALAMGTQMTLSTDLTRLSTRDLSALRATLVHYNAFEGETHFVGSPFARSFATTSGGITYLGALNRSGDASTDTFNLSDYGLSSHQDYLLYDVAANRYIRVRGSFTAQLSGHSFRLFLLRDAPGVVWTNSSLSVESGSRSLKLQVAGPESINGFAQIYVPLPSSVRLDGQSLGRAATPKSGSNYSYDRRTGILRVRYPHDRPHTIEVDY